MRRKLHFAAVLLVVAAISAPVMATIHNVSISNFAFTPTKTTVNPGDTVRWTWVAGVHSSTSTFDSPKSWDSGVLGSGTFEQVFTVGDGPGPFPYFCSVHFGMVDTIFMNAPSAEPTRFVFTLDEAQADGGAGTGSFASGYAFATLSADSAQLAFEVYHDVSSPTLAHVHFAPPGVEGGVRLSFSSAASPIIQTFNVTPTDVADLFAGDLYVNVHSSTFGTGEIRGQIVQTGLLFGFTMSGPEGGTASTATGFCVCELSPDLSTLDIYCEHNVANTIDGHVHMGAPGINGPIQFGFTSALSPISESWSLADIDVDHLLAETLYVNIHSNAFPSGEIRGQLDFDPITLNVLLDEAQADACNGTGSSATGMGTAELTPGGKELTVSMTHDVSSPIDGHIHLGANCVQGPIQFGFSSPVSPINDIWYLSTNDAINFFQEELYVNVHSTMFPVEEIRGQLGDPPTLGCCVGLIRGNFDGDGGDAIDIGDLLYMVDYQFGNPAGPAPPCFEEGDYDASSGIDIGDLLAMVDFQFGNPAGPAPAPCP